MVEIETSRLRLRQFIPDDLDDLFRLYSDVEVMKYLLPRSKEQTQASLNKHIQHWQEYNLGCGLSFIRIAIN